MVKWDSMEHKIKVMNAKAEVPLITQLKSANSDVAQVAIETLAHIISDNEDFCDRVINEGAIYPLLELIVPDSSVKFTDTTIANIIYNVQLDFYK